MVPVYCPLCCDQPFDDQASLYFHLRGVRNNLFCPICSEKFASLEVLVSHLAKKCAGPESPLLAKRKCLAKINEEPVILEKKLRRSPPLQLNASGYTNSDNSTVEGEGVGDVSESQDDNEEEQSSNNYGKSIPDVLRKKLSKNVSVVMKSPETPQLVTRAQVHSRLENETHLKNIAFPKFIGDPSPNRVPAKKKTPVKIPVQHNWDSSDEAEIQDSSVNTTALIPLKSTSKAKTTANLNNQSLWPQLKTQRILLNNEKSQKQPLLAVNLGKSPSVFMANQKSNVVASSSNNSGVFKSLPSKIIMPVPGNFVTFPAGKGMKPPKRPLKPSIIVLPDANKTSSTQKKNENNAQLSDNDSDFSFGTYDDNTTNSDTVSIKSTSDSPDKAMLEAKKRESTKGKSLQWVSLPKAKSKEVIKKSAVDGKEKDNKLKDKRSKQEEKNEVNKKTESRDDKDGNQKENDKDGAEEEYTCSACNIRFTSIYEHIKKYHNGEEVVVEVPEEELKEEVRAYQHGQESSKSKTNETVVVNGEIPKDLNMSSSKNEVSSTNKSVSAPNKELPNKSLTPKTSKKPKQTNNRKPNGNKTQKPDSSNCESDGDKTVQVGPLPDTDVSPKMNRSKGKWVMTEKCGKRAYFQYLYNPNKNQILMKEMKTNKTPHPLYGSTIQTLFENPKINVVEITDKPNTPYFTDRIVDLKNPIPMYVTVRSVESEKEEMLGGRASYIIANSIPTSDRVNVPKDSKVIAVMKVLLASDKKLTLENIVFKEKPVNEFMIPFLEDVENPELPLLKGAKMLKWRCTKCLATTWQFPLTRDSHFCFSCHLCHKPFVGTQGLRAHMVLHNRDLELLCAECHRGFGTNGSIPLNHGQCAECGLFVKREDLSTHQSLHINEPELKFNCSACESVFQLTEKAKVKEKEEVKTARSPVRRMVAKHSCGECDRKFHSLTALAYHGLEHKQNSLQYPCNFCPKKFLRKKEQCPRQAGKRKPSIYIQKVWHEKIHTRKRTHRCAGCPKTFRSEWHFREHAAAAHKYEVTTRAPLPIFACDQCTQTFSNGALLAAHTASRHSA